MTVKGAARSSGASPSPEQPEAAGPFGALRSCSATAATGGAPISRAQRAPPLAALPPPLIPRGVPVRKHCLFGYIHGGADSPTCPQSRRNAQPRMAHEAARLPGHTPGEEAACARPPAPGNGSWKGRLPESPWKAAGLRWDAGDADCRRGNVSLFCASFRSEGCLRHSQTSSSIS